MNEITAATAADYLRESGRVAASEPVEVRELPGGVSNVVLLVTLPARVGPDRRAGPESAARPRLAAEGPARQSGPTSGERFVLKQARGQLRVQEEWLCPVERIWREVEVLRVCGELLRTGDYGLPIGAASQRADWMFLPCVPDVLWEDRENYCYAMTAADPRHRTWKELLLAGKTMLSQFVAAVSGRLLGALHAGTWHDATAAARFEDRSFFDKLRLDPYYRFTARVHGDLTPRLNSVIDSVWSHRQCLVHGDFSPKNLLVWPLKVMLIDFEVGHYGDPAFDLGFFLTHLVVKAIRARAVCRQYVQLVAIFWREYHLQLARVASAAELSGLHERMLLNLAGCLLARVDGKSPLKYLDPLERQVIRQLGREWLVTPPDRLTDTDWNAT